VHFDSRDELVAAAVTSGADETAERVLGDSAGSLDDTLKRYLSLEHVKHPAFGCVLAALGTEGRQQPSVVRKAFRRAATGFIALLDKKLHPRRSSPAPSDDALALASTMIGAVVLARLVDDDALAGRILDAARRR
jgi:TetR/AcrR family transcriptional regulator, transcriptional repressor for nem operon